MGLGEGSPPVFGGDLAALRGRKGSLRRGGCCLFSALSLLALLLVHFLHFHPPVLEPDFDLSLAQVEEPGHLVPTVPGQVHIEQKLLLQFQGLVFGVGASLFPGGAGVQPAGSGVGWKKKQRDQYEASPECFSEGFNHAIKY